VTVPRWLPAAAITVFAAGITWLNRDERVALDIGITTFYRAPLTMVLFLAFLAGMLSMLWLSLRHDRRVRHELRRHGLMQPEPARPASAWGMAREPAQPREPAQSREPVSTRGEDERTMGYPRYDEQPARPREEDDRTIVYPRYDEDPIA
jgi:hypothetical protein